MAQASSRAQDRRGLLAYLEFLGPRREALFTIGPDSDGEPLLIWLAIGYHADESEADGKIRAG